MKRKVTIVLVDRPKADASLHHERVVPWMGLERNQSQSSEAWVR
jgi:hypothetical protein